MKEQNKDLQEEAQGIEEWRELVRLTLERKLHAKMFIYIRIE